MATLRRSPAFKFLSAWALASIILTTLLPGLAFGAPLVAITRPTQGATVSGQIWIDVAFSSDSNLPITRLEVYIDDQLAREVDLAQPLLMGRQSFNWDFSYSSNSVHKIGARAIDAGNNSANASITVQVQNAATSSGPDVIAPVVRIYYPAHGSKISGRQEIKAEATDNVGVELVYFYIDGRLHKMMMNAPPYVDAWDTTKEADGLHVLEAVAVDKAENEARSAQVTVIVENRSQTTLAAGAGQLLTTGISPSSLPEVPVGVPTPGMTLPATPPVTTAVPTPILAPPAPVVTERPVAVAAPTLTEVLPAAPPQPVAERPATVPTPPAPTVSERPAVAPPAPAAPAEAPKMVELKPWAPPPAYVPPPPTISLPPIGSASPIVMGDSRQGGLAPAILPNANQATDPVQLGLPGVQSSQPVANAGTGTAPKTLAPIGPLAVAGTTPLLSNVAVAPDAPSGPVAIRTTTPQPGLQPVKAAAASSAASVQPDLAIPSPRLAVSSPVLPALGKTAAPAGTLKHEMTGRVSTPAPSAVAAETPAPIATPHRSGLMMAAQPAPAVQSRVTAVGPTVATTDSQPVAVQPAALLTPEHAVAPSPGLTRVTTPPAVAAPVAPERVAINMRPPAAPLITDAALAEYRGLPVPASRMTSRLPEGNAAAISADGRVTVPQGDVAAIPVAIHKVRDIKIVFDGEVLSLRATPETRAGISLAPLREIFEQTDGVLYWFPVEKRVQAVNKNVDVQLTIGDSKASVNGEQRTLQVAPFIKRGRTMVPLQFIADVLDVNIAVNSATGQIVISSNQL